MADEANLEKAALENRVENMENTLKELLASFQSLQATLVTRAPLTTNPLFKGNVSAANLPIATSTLGKEPMSSCPLDLTIGGTSGTKPFVLNAGVATVQFNDQEKTQVVKSIIEDEDKAIKAKVQLMEETLKLMQGVQTNKPIDISSLCFFPNIQLLHKFKLPEFDKYNGIGCPYAHLTIGGVGHDLETCLALKQRVQDLIDAKELQIASEPEVVGLNITKNPLPTHNGPTVNMIEKDSNKDHEVITSTNIDGLSTSFGKLSVCIIDEGMDDDKVSLPAHGESLDNETVEILHVPIIKS
ncbi:hypothetical protein SLEP1_g3593 [Rubroshorea leprosula]|uniref:Uncharacterized protein n=1 Tax=Rubroshorea leprosula TaxID=152421 RepID=A0AAV5HV91_9ROSI|nr:hypothetical protein SLEP1_g3593 [Rubroshorea leprosula]